jgi:hypothetical protein
MPTAIERELFGPSLDEQARLVLDKLRKLFPFVDYSKLQLKYLKDGTTSKLGDCNYETSVIRLHPGLEGDDFKETLVHELAHYTAYNWKKERGHGYYWGFVVIFFGYEPSRLAPDGILDRALMANKNERRQGG